MSPAFVASAVAGAAIAALAIWIARDPYRLIRIEFERQRRKAGLARRSLSIDGRRWVYASREANRPGAPTVVMVHGYTGSKENWYPLARRLRGRYRLLVPDLPGWGESERVAGADHGFSAQAANVAAFIRATCDRPVVLLGHSMGGGIAALVAARHPDLVARVGLLDAAGVRFADNQFGLDVLAGRNPFAVTDTQSLQHYFDILFFDRSALPPMPWPVPKILVSQRRADADFEQAVLDRIGRGEEQFLPGAEAAGIRQPALLLWGTHDRVIDPSAMDIYGAKMPQARKVLLDRSAHMALMEQPDEVAAAVTDLIETGEPA